jgi:hypothetical protein
MCVFGLKVISLLTLARPAPSVTLFDWSALGNFLRGIFIEERSRKVGPRAQNVAVVFGLLLFWSW